VHLYLLHVLLLDTTTVLPGRHRVMELVALVFVVVVVSVVRYVVGDLLLLADGDGGLEAPAGGDVVDGVSATWLHLPVNQGGHLRPKTQSHEGGPFVRQGRRPGSLATRSVEPDHVPRFRCLLN
jgi:hypothetical protein